MGCLESRRLFVSGPGNYVWTLGELRTGGRATAGKSSLGKSPFGLPRLCGGLLLWAQPWTRTRKPANTVNDLLRSEGYGRAVIGRS